MILIMRRLVDEIDINEFHIIKLTPCTLRAVVGVTFGVAWKYVVETNTSCKGRVFTKSIPVLQEPSAIKI